MRSGKGGPEQSDFAQLVQLRCINPSGVLADTTSLYTREALLPSSSGSALEHHSLLPREADCHVAALAAPRNDPVEDCGCSVEPLSQRLRPLTAPLTGEPLVGSHRSLP